MARRALLAAGVAAGAAALVGAVRLLRAAGPQTASERSAGWGASLSAFAADVRAGMAEREEELRVALGVDAGTIDEATARDLLERPTAPRHAARPDGAGQPGQPGQGA